MNFIDYDLPRSRWERLINEWTFNEVDRTLLKRRLLDGVCFEPLSEEVGLSERQVKKRFYKAETELFKHVK